MFFLFVLTVFFSHDDVLLSGDPGSKGSKPEFMEEMSNVTVFLGRTANIACTVKDLRTHRVSNETESSSRTFLSSSLF